MKISKKVFIPVLLVIALICIFAGTKVYKSKYPMPNIKSSQIKTIRVYHDKDSKVRKTYNSDGQKLLNYTSKILSKSTSTGDENECKYEDFAESESQYAPKNYFVEVNFTTNVDLKIKDTTIKCNKLTINLDKKQLFYNNTIDYNLTELDASDADFEKLGKYLNSHF